MGEYHFREKHPPINAIEPRLPPVGCERQAQKEIRTPEEENETKKETIADKKKKMYRRPNARENHCHINI